MVRKTNAFEEKGAAMGHNKPSEESAIKHVEFIAKQKDKIDMLNKSIKDRLNMAKDEGHLKGAIRGAIKDLRKTESQRQADDEVQKERDRIFNLCKDLPLFNNNARDE